MENNSVFGLNTLSDGHSLRTLEAEIDFEATESQYPL